MRVKREHYECQLVDLEKHREQLQQNLNQLQLEQLHAEIELLTIDLESLNQKLSEARNQNHNHAQTRLLSNGKSIR